MALIPTPWRIVVRFQIIIVEPKCRESRSENAIPDRQAVDNDTLQLTLVTGTATRRTIAVVKQFALVMVMTQSGSEVQLKCDRDLE